MHRLIGLALFGLLAARAVAQPQPYARVYGGEQGLPSNIVTEVLEDQRGYLWLATGKGLCRFDGYGFANLHANSGSTDANVLFLEIDSSGRLWFATLERNIYYVQGDSILPFAGNARIGELTQNRGTPHGFSVSPQGDSLFLAVGQSGILCMDRSGHARLEAPRPPANRIAWAAYGQLLLTQVGRAKREGEVAPAGLFYDLRQPAQPVALEFPPLRRGEPQGLASFLLEENTYLITSGIRIYHVQGTAWQWHAEMPERPLHIGRDSAGAIYISLQNGAGLRRYRDLNALQQGDYTTIAPGLSVRWWYADRQGGWWVATQEQGVLYYPNPVVWVHTDFPGIAPNRPYSIAISDPQTVYVGFGQGKVCRLDLASGKAGLLPPIPLANTVFDLAFDARNQRLWAATNYASYFENGAWVAPPFPGDRGIPAAYIGASADGERLYFSSQKGLVRLDGHSLEWRSSLTQKDNTGVLDAWEDASGTVWAATPAGLFRWSESAFLMPGIEHPALRRPISNLALMPDTALVFTDGKAVFWWKDDKVRCLSCEVGIEDQLFGKLLADPQGRIWMIAASQLLCLEPGSNGACRARIYSQAQGLPPGNLKALSHHDGKIWVVADAGVAALPVDLPPAAPAAVMIETVWVNNQPQLVGPGRRFAFSENNLTFQLATLNFKTADRTRYRYRLREDARWQESTERLLRFFSLGEGRYHLEIQAQNEDGAWGEPLVFPFHIQPPFYRAWWFLGGLALLLLGGGFAFFRYRLREVQKEAALREQIDSLERSALQAQMNPHFIFNSLNSIQQFILKNERQRAAQYLATFARLVRDTLNASVEGRIALDDELRMIDHYLSLEKLRFAGRFDYSLEVAEGTDAYDIILPPLLIQPFVENAVLHGMKHADGQGFIRVFFEEKAQALWVTIEDNGPGRAAAAAQHTPSDEPPRAAHKSVGMGITQKRLELLGGRSGGRDALSIEDIHNADGEVQGTRVRVRVALEQ
jgi:ligand-binding sensor domain-containing protein